MADGVGVVLINFDKIHLDRVPVIFPIAKTTRYLEPIESYLIKNYCRVLLGIDVQQKLQSPAFFDAYKMPLEYFVDRLSLQLMTGLQAKVANEEIPAYALEAMRMTAEIDSQSLLGELDAINWFATELGRSGSFATVAPQLEKYLLTLNFGSLLDKEWRFLAKIALNLILGKLTGKKIHRFEDVLEVPLACERLKETLTGC